MAVIKAKKVPKSYESSEDLLARFCYHFPQYKYNQARKLPYKRVTKMLEIARKERAKLLLDLTSIVSAPHTKKGSGVKKLTKRFEEIIEGK